MRIIREKTTSVKISRYFQRIWYGMARWVNFKLIQNGVLGTLLKLLQNYLNNRKQRVVLNGSSADFSTIESGVPQGSVRGPLLFPIYVNDLEKNIKSNINLFADDTMFFSMVNHPVISANDLNHDLKVWSLILTPVSNSYFLVKNPGHTTHLSFSMELR